MMITMLLLFFRMCLGYNQPFVQKQIIYKVMSLEIRKTLIL